jgi:hypothetical protein
MKMKRKMESQRNVECRILKIEGSETTETLRAGFVQALELFSGGFSNAWKIKKGRAVTARPLLFSPLPSS